MSGLRGRERKLRLPPTGASPADDLFSQSPDKLHSLLAATRQLDRVASSPCLGNIKTPFLHESERASSRGSLDTYLLEDIEPVNFDAVNAAVTEILNDLVNALVDAKTRQISATLSKFYNTITTREIFRRVVLDRLDWQIESCLSTLVPVLVRGKGSRVGSGAADAIKALRCAIFIVLSLQRMHIESSVSGTLLESIVQACLTILPRVGEIGGSDKYVSSPHVMWLAYAFIGELIRLELATDCLPQDFADSITSGAKNGAALSVTWRDWLEWQTQRWVKRKKAQQKQALAQDTFPIWTHDDIADLDGLCMCLSSWMATHTTSIVYNRSTDLRSSFGFIWKFVESLSDILSVNTVEIVNTYVSGMPSEILKPKGSQVVLGLALFLGQVYESWWEVQFLSSETTNFNPLKDFDLKLIRALEVFGGKPTTADSNKLSRNLSKEVAKIFREVCSTIECGESPATTSINIKLADVADGVSQTVTTENPLANRLVGEVMEISTWRQSQILRVCREFCGHHSNLVCAMHFEYSGENVFTGGGHLTQDRKSRDRQLASNKKLMKQERQFLTSAKQAARELEVDDD